MDLGDLAVRVWARRYRSLALAVIAAAIGIVATYHVSFSPMSLRPKSLRFGAATTELLVNAGQSTLAYSTPSLASTYLASNISQAMDSNVVTDGAARALHVSPDTIAVQQQYLENVPRLQYYAQETQVANQVLASRHRFSLLVRNDQNTFVIQLFAQAPTGQQAITLANAAAQARATHITALGRAGNIPKAERVMLTQLGPATGGLVDPTAPRDAAILVGLGVWLLAMIASLSIDGIRRRRRETTVAAPTPSGA